MKDNEQIESSASHCARCVDLPYLFLAIVLIAGVTGLAIFSADASALEQMAQPRDISGNVCPQSAPYLEFQGTTISQRSCVSVCSDSTPNYRLGGVCMTERIEYVLKQRGEYHYLGRKQSILTSFSVILGSVCATGAVGLLLGLLSAMQLVNKLPQNNCMIQLLMGFALATSLVALYLLLPLHFSLRNSYSIVWLIFCAAFIIFGVFLTALWASDRGVKQETEQSSLGEEARDWKDVTRIFIYGLVFALLNIGMGVLCIGEYLVFQAHAAEWKSPNVYAEAHSVGWREVLVLIQLCYWWSFSICSYEYLVSSTFSVSDPSTVVGRYFCQHLGSVCLLSFIRLLLFPFIFVLNIIKPLERDKLAEGCHCLCGLVLNAAHRYSLPVGAYQCALKHRIGLSEAARRVHYEWHISQNQFNSAYLEKLGIGCLMISVAIISAKCISYSQDTELDVRVLIACVVWGLSISIYPACTLLFGKEGKMTRKILLQNRHQ